MSFHKTVRSRGVGGWAVLGLLCVFLAMASSGAAQDESPPGFDRIGTVHEFLLLSPPFPNAGRIDEQLWRKPVRSPVEDARSIWLRMTFEQAGDYAWTMEIKDAQNMTMITIKQEELLHRALPIHIWTPEITGSVAHIEIYGNGYHLAFQVDRIAVKTADITPQSVAQPPQLVWNLWAEKEDGPWFQPQLHLEPNTRYRIALHLSWFKYREEQDGVQSWEGDPELQQSIVKWLKDTLKTKITLEAFLLYDGLYFEPLQERVIDFEIQLQKIRTFWKDKAARIDRDAFAIMAEGGDPAFIFGHTVFEVQTRGREGWASLGIVLFHEGRPIDEITARFCIGRCDGSHLLTQTLRGIDSLAVAAKPTPLPDASLYFLEVEAGHLHGVFRRNDIRSVKSAMENYKVWAVTRSPIGFMSYLENTWLPAVKDAKDDATLLQRGTEFLELLFPSYNEDAREAQAAFQAFVKARVRQPGQSILETPPSLFVRIVTRSPDPPPLIPLGLLVVETPEGKKDFLGFHFRVEVPMEIQTYESRLQCPSHWVTVLPSERRSDDLGKAVLRMGSTYDQWRQRSPLAQPFDSMTAFGDWLRNPSVEEPPTALWILSHHTRNTLSYSNVDLMLSTSVQRRFKEPSIVILNGCATAGPGAADLIRHFNRVGIETVVATSSEVDAEMAGDFFRCFNDLLQKNRDTSPYPIAQAYFETLQYLRNQKPSRLNAQKYGASVLKYVLLGNGNLRLCPPIKESR